MKCRIPNNKLPISNNTMHRNIRRVMDNHKMPEEAIDAVLHLYDFMVEKDYYGGCHALSSALYVALSELGFSPELYVGECQVPGMLPFDHSWVTLNGDIIDVAVYFPLTQKINSMSGPVVFGVDVVTSHPPRTLYGIDSGLPLAADTTFVINSDFVDYMDNFPLVRGGLWTLVKVLLPATNTVTISELRTRYGGVTRKYVKLK